MSEFQDKVKQYKQTIVDDGFKTDDSMGGITDSPTISVNEPADEGNPQEVYENVDPYPQQKQRKTSRKTVEGLKRRIDQVTFEKSVREAQTQELLARIQDQEQRLAQQQSLLEQNEQYKNAYYENNLQTREAGIINELKVAKEEGDIDKEIALSKELAKVTADQSTYGLYKSQLKNQSTHNYNDPDIYPEPTYGNNIPVPEPTYDEPVNEAYDLWLERNPWADPESRNYSPRLRDEANQLADEINERLRYNGNSDIIGTPAYFDSIENLMSQRYGLQNEAKPQKEQSQYYNVAPVSRNGSSMADQYMTRNPNNTRRHIPLSEDEYKIARNLQIKLPNGKYATGDEAVLRYSEAKRMQNPSGSNKLVIE
jgi:hypothetical protein